MSQRELIIKVDGRGVDGDTGMILVYRDGERVSMVVTAEKNGDAEVILDRPAAVRLVDALADVLGKKL